MALTKQEINRKLFHLFALLLPIGIFYFPILGLPDFVAPVILALLLITIGLIETLRFRYPKIHQVFQKYFRSMLRKEEARTLTGSTYFIAGSFICALLFRYTPHIAFMVLTMFLLGDAAAALAGLSFGKIKIGEKSLEGSLACFTVCSLTCFALFPHIPFLLDKWDGAVPLPLIFITSFIITVLELVPLKITRTFTLNDNLYVPVIAGMFMRALYPTFC